jgi:hypothetical protein
MKKSARYAIAWLLGSITMSIASALSCAVARLPRAAASWGYLHVNP